MDRITRRKIITNTQAIGRDSSTMHGRHPRHPANNIRDEKDAMASSDLHMKYNLDSHTLCTLSIALLQSPCPTELALMDLNLKKQGLTSHRQTPPSRSRTSFLSCTAPKTHFASANDQTGLSYA